MEENIHDDKLDDYVRKSFEDYEAMPSTEMWDRVEAELLPAAKKPLTVHLRRYAWQLLAASVIIILFSTLICEHYRYEAKLKVLIEQYAITPSTLPQKDEGGEGGLNKGKVNDQELKVAIPGVGKSAKTARIHPTRKSNDSPGQNPLQPGITPTGIVSPAIVLSAPQADDSAFVLSATQKIFDADLISLRTAGVQWPAQTSISLKLARIKPVAKPSNWYLGLQTSILAIREKTPALTARPGRFAFASKPENVDVAAIYWLKAGKKLNTRISIESGIGYQKTVQTAIHSPRFRFADGINPGIPLGTRRHFNYDLSTYNGTAEVSLRMEQATPGAPPGDDEPVSLKITTTERTEVLQLPVLLKYRLNTGKLQAYVKAGLLGNLILKNELDLLARVSQNARFRPVDGQNGYTLQLNPAGKFSVGYWLSGGAEFKFTHRLSLSAEPALTGDFSRKDGLSRKLPKRIYMGVNLGANFYF